MRRPRDLEHERPTSDRRVDDLIRYGRVDSVNAAKLTIRVKWQEEDEGAEVSGDLPMLVQRSGDYALPATGTLAVCLMQPGSDDRGVVLGFIYSDEDEPPLNDEGRRAIVSDDLRLGEHDADAPVALAPKVKEELQQLKEHFEAFESVITGGVINEPGNGAPSAFQIALKAAILGSQYPTPGDVGAEKVKAK